MSYCFPVVKMFSIIYQKYYLDNNIINRRKDTVFLIHSLVFVLIEKLLKYKLKRSNELKRKS